MDGGRRTEYGIYRSYRCSALLYEVLGVRRISDFGLNVSYFVFLIFVSHISYLVVVSSIASSSSSSSFSSSSLFFVGRDRVHTYITYEMRSTISKSTI